MTFTFDNLSFRPFDDACDWDAVTLSDTLKFDWLTAYESLPVTLLEDVEEAALDEARERYLARERDMRAEMSYRSRT